MNPYKNLSSSILRSIAKLLHYSLKPVDYQYDGLTKEEKELLTEAEFKELVTWLTEPTR